MDAVIDARVHDQITRDCRAGDGKDKGPIENGFGELQCSRFDESTSRREQKIDTCHLSEYRAPAKIEKNPHHQNQE